MSVRKRRNAANELAKRVMKRLNTRDRNEVQCPREKSWMTPCVARDGATACDDGGECVGCGKDPLDLLRGFRATHG